MKILTLIIHSGAQQDVADRLRAMSEVTDFSFSRVEGHSVQLDSDPLLTAYDKVVGYTPRVRADMLLDDADVTPVLARLREAGGGDAGPGGNSLAGQCVYWVMPVEQGGRL